MLILTYFNVVSGRFGSREVRCWFPGGTGVFPPAHPYPPPPGFPPPSPRPHTPRGAGGGAGRFGAGAVPKGFRGAVTKFGVKGPVGTLDLDLVPPLDATEVPKGFRGAVAKFGVIGHNGTLDLGLVPGIVKGSALPRCPPYPSLWLSVSLPSYLPRGGTRRNGSSTATAVVLLISTLCLHCVTPAVSSLRLPRGSLCLLNITYKILTEIKPPYQTPLWLSVSPIPTPQSLGAGDGGNGAGGSARAKSMMRKQRNRVF